MICNLGVVGSNPALPTVYIQKKVCTIQEKCINLQTVTNNFGNKIAEVAQLVERQPSKLNVAGSTPVFRSKLFLL